MTSRKKTVGIPFTPPPESYPEAAKQQRAIMRKAAKAIEHGEPVAPRFRRVMAMVLRDAAAKHPVSQTRSRGKPAEIDTGGLMLLYGWYRVHDRMNRGKAIAKLAELEPDISIDAIIKAVNECGAEAMSQFLKPIMPTINRL